MKSKRVFLTMLISQILFGLFSFIWFFMAVMSVMMFDIPGSEKVLWAQLLFVAIWMYPIGLIGSIIVSWILYHFRKMKLAVAIAMIPLIWVIPFLSLLGYANFS